MADEGNGTGSNAVWAIALIIIVAIIAGVVYYSGVLIDKNANVCGKLLYNK